ncbi:asparaginase [Paraburkholderia sp. MMS20-SJTR3]|uniref:Asparaginase n=1 Tax=Paraburkholderia sejongensis TaxID=2886946 RepID=A0ABS8K3X5_9BURK|nr:asparaginase [Paraburkholderia sp. MMS20-SJTR3]MCC8396862.1 asparaginase [Paraburkholderia sp. MMS20-SJTR3]
MTLPSHVPLVVATRNTHVERVHWGSVAVVDAAGALLAHAGDPHAWVFSRSTLKPFQALPFVRDGGPDHFGFTDKELALCCASHGGEDVHVDTVTAMLTKIGRVEADLRCGTQMPDHYGEDDLPPRGSVFDQRHHNCSGKHAGFLAYCCMHGYAHATYLERDHELQQEIARETARLAELPPSDLWFGVDGCSAPNIGMPLSRLAMMWGKLAAGASGAGASSDAALMRIFSAMAAHPQMVSGTGRCDFALAQASKGDWVAKVGADGVHTVGVRSHGIGIAVKMADGDFTAVYATTIAVLRQLGLPLETEGTPLAKWADPVLRNVRGTAVGQLKATVQLTWA